jgi:hypothetical protein
MDLLVMIWHDNVGSVVVGVVCELNCLCKPIYCMIYELNHQVLLL